MVEAHYLGERTRPVLNPFKQNTPKPPTGSGWKKLNKTICVECKRGDCLNCSATRQSKRVMLQEDLTLIPVCVCVCFGQWYQDQEID